MKTYPLEISLESPTIAASGEGWNAVIDTDIVFDDLGLPYIPSKRIKGCLKDAAQDIDEMFDLAGIDFKKELDINNTFGQPGLLSGASVYFANLTIEDYENTRQWLNHLMAMQKYDSIISPEAVLKTFTDLRWQTAIADGVAEKHSLRTARVIRKGVRFLGNIQIVTELPGKKDIDESKILNTLILACSVCRHMGTSRTRGFGEITCRLKSTDGTYFPIPEKLEASCMN
jgi:CRISPR-associated protein Csx10